MKVFVTGGTGFVGKKLCQRLLKEGHTVTALARSESSAKKLSEFSTSSFVGSFDDIAAWESKLQGHDVVIHCAAPVLFWGKWETFQKDIVDATINLMKAAEKQGVKRFIHLSSESVLQDNRTPSLLDIDETYPYPKEPNSFYGKSKQLAEKAILNHPGKIESIILRPTFIWGKGVDAVEGMVEKVKGGQFMWVDHGKSLIETVHVDNVVEAIMLSLTKGTTKNVYILTDGRESQPVKDVLTALIQTKGVTPPNKSIPAFLAKTVARICEFFWKLFGIYSEPPLSLFALAFVSQSRRYDISKIQRELGYKPIKTFQEGVDEMK